MKMNLLFNFIISLNDVFADGEVHVMKQRRSLQDACIPDLDVKSELRYRDTVSSIRTFAFFEDTHLNVIMI